MPEVEKYEVLALGSGGAGKFIAWTMAKDGHKAAMVDTGPWEAPVRTLRAFRARTSSTPIKSRPSRTAAVSSVSKIGSLQINMAKVQRRKREMVEGLHQMHVWARRVSSRRRPLKSR